MSYFIVDCEARYGVTSPVIESMTECGVVLLDKPPFATAFHWPKDGDIAALNAWVLKHSVGSATFISDNPAFDWQWVAAEFARAGIDNPFGFSARRIGDFAAGLKRNFRDANSWKRHRRTTHDHNPVNDARGNAEALWHLLRSADAEQGGGEVSTKPKCKVCRRVLRETALGKLGKGPLTELRCPKCRVLFYTERLEPRP